VSLEAESAIGLTVLGKGYLAFGRLETSHCAGWEHARVADSTGPF
jgi:hypothetical protein